MSRKIARITQDKKLLLANEVVEDNTKTSLNSDGRLDTDEIIEYPAELEGGRNLLKGNPNNEPILVKVNNNYYKDYSTDIVLEVGQTYTFSWDYDIKTTNQTLNIAVGAGENVYSRDIMSLIPIEYGKVTFTVEERHLERGNKFFYRLSRSINPNTSEVEYRSIKLEKGSQATPWTPAPEDLGLNYPDSIQNFNSSISGNNIITPEFIEGYPFVKPVIDDSLILWLDGSTGNNYEQTGTWKDLSGSGNDGKLRNFGYTEGSGWVDGGLKFDGVDDWVEVDNVNTVNGNFTVEMICDMQSDGAYFAFKNQTDNWSFLVQRRTSTYYRVRTWTWPDSGMVGTDYSLTPLENGTLCFRVLDRVLSVFMNGEKKQEIFLKEFDPFAKLIIGSYTGGGPNHINGIVNSFKLYNRALTDEEILQNYRAGQCSPLLAMRGDV